MKKKIRIRKIYDIIEIILILVMLAGFIYNLLVDNYEMAILLLLALCFGTVVDGFKREAELIQIMFDYMDLMCKMQLEDLKINDVELEEKPNNKKKEKNNGKKFDNTKK